jgi:hypothetical protein
LRTAHIILEGLLARGGSAHVHVERHVGKGQAPNGDACLRRSLPVCIAEGIGKTILARMSEDE